MASASIRTRTVSGGRKRYDVTYRLGGRAYPKVHGGSFGTLREAETRRTVIAGWLAAGRNPAAELANQLEPAKPRLTLGAWCERYKTTRIDISPATMTTQSYHLKAMSTLAGRDPATLTPADVQEWVTGLSADLKPSSIRLYLQTLRLVLDFAGCDPNPARDRRVKLPAIVTEEILPPTVRQFLGILDKLPARLLLPTITIEQTAMRVGEVETLAWGDVDVAESRFRLRAGATKTRKPRWVQVPSWLMGAITATCPLEDRTAERRVFQGLNASSLRSGMANACKLAGLPLFSPHDLRHRRLSLWHGQGVPAKELADRAGHSKASMTLDTYSHVMPLEEAPTDTLQTLLNVL